MATATRSFLGTGWSFPPTFSRAVGGVLMVSDDTDIQESLTVLLSTIPGERIMVPGYGCDLWSMVFRALDTTLLTQLKDLVYQAILNWEPRITVDDIAATTDADVVGLVLIFVDYTIRTTNTRSNLVYPFHTQEATIGV